MDFAIEFQHVTKTFPGVVALDDVSFAVRRGEVHALVGENGAGKSTLLNILHGGYSEYAGTVKLNGTPVQFRNPHDAIHAGVSKVHQEISLVPNLTVAQNIFLGYEPRMGPLVDFHKMNRDAENILKRLRSPLRPDGLMVGVSAGEMQMISVAKALFHDAQVISLDEPTSSLSSAETDALMSIVRELKEHGITIFYVSHRLDEVFDLSDRVTILRDGKLVGSYETSEISRAELIRKMVGRDVSTFATRKQPRRVQPEVVLEVEDLSSPGLFEDIRFSLHKGEILGFAGLVGAKRTDVMRAVFGADPVVSGKVTVHGKVARITSPMDALERGIGLVPENRKTEGFVRYLTNEANISLTCLRRFQRLGFVDRSLRRSNADTYIQRLNVNPPRSDFPTENMSGGNQQKVVVAKWLSTQADILILDEPTKGIDVGAKAEMYALLEDLVAAGKSIILVSSELPELIGLCDRAVVMKEGRIVAEVSADEMSEELLLNYAMEGVAS
ncbi:MAG: sugar ABC transporter ATP-binding protein [Spirochaetaceae bacterium]|nr:MAG: sugar ABC transporter ATP-binding protein [Spirochaetaceae bacterium]